MRTWKGFGAGKRGSGNLAVSCQSVLQPWPNKVCLIAPDRLEPRLRTCVSPYGILITSAVYQTVEPLVNHTIIQVDCDYADREDSPELLKWLAQVIRDALQQAVADVLKVEVSRLLRRSLEGAVAGAATGALARAVTQDRRVVAGTVLLFGLLGYLAGRSSVREVPAFSMVRIPGGQVELRLRIAWK